MPSPLIDVTTTRSFSGARKGVTLRPGAEQTLFVYTLSTGQQGQVTQQWYTGDLLDLEFGAITIRMYFDANTTQSQVVQYQLMLAHGMGFNTPNLTPWGVRAMGSTALSGGLYNNFKFPFSSSVRVTAQLPSGSKEHAFYYIMRGLEATAGTLPLIVGQMSFPSTTTRLRLQQLNGYLGQRNEEITLYNSTAGMGGALYLVAMQANSSSLSYLEGRFRAYVDGEEQDLSSGTEDYFLSAQYFDLGVFHTDNSGCTHMDRFVTHSFSAYKFHVQDPVLFHKSFALTWRVGDGLHKDTAATLISTYVWVYEFKSPE